MPLAVPFKFFGVAVVLASSLVWVSAPIPKAAPSENVERDLVTGLVTALSIEAISAYTPFTQFARAVYCNPRETSTWTCGEYLDHLCLCSILTDENLDACRANPDFQPTLTGGNGAGVPYCASVRTPTLRPRTRLARGSLHSLCRVLAGTKRRGRFTSGNRSNLAVGLLMILQLQTEDVELIFTDPSVPPFSLAIITDLKINKVSLDTSLFPGAPSDARVHRGFRDAHMATASTILTEVNNLISSKGATSVITVSFPGDFLAGDTYPQSRSDTRLGELLPNLIPSCFD